LTGDAPARPERDGPPLPSLLRRPSDLLREVPAEPRPARGANRHLAWPAGFAGSQKDRAALVVLLSLASVTPRRLLELAVEHRTAAECLSAVRGGRGASVADVARANAADPGPLLRRVQRAGATLVCAGDPAYPEELLELFDPPAALFVRGRPLPAMRPRVAIVGARHCSQAGRDTAMLLAGSLAAAGVCVVSGAAWGIDAAAHEGSLKQGGPTVAVLGCGIDAAYPPRNRGLIERVAGTGAVVSEYPPGIRAEPFRFPARNRIVAALSAGVVVVEGAERSGSLITTEHALDMGREVFAVPGPITSALSAAPLRLIREGATLIRGPQDLLEDLGLDASTAAAMAGGGVGAAGVPGGDDGAVWSVLAGPATPDAIAERTGLPLGAVSAALVRLELRGLARRAGGRYEARVQAGVGRPEGARRSGR
jgi:DNA processing protein